ncbi:replication-relaxation family protein [Candidatus Saccharibacteria bacterium]|nr:replication-relaxation family protein [Candidatus Saccharibacteria bacterium]
MVDSKKEVKLTAQQQRVLKLLFKFRFVSAQLLVEVIGINRRSVYEVLEYLVKQNLVTKVYKSEYRLHGRPAYYYLNKTGVTTVRKLMDVKESVVHALYKNDQATDDYVQHCLKLISLYSYLLSSLPDGTDIFTKSEINRLSYFPKNKPDLYIRTPDDKEAIVVLVDDKAPYIIRKRLDEIITHSEDEGWNGDYPKICFVLADTKAKYSFLYSTNKTLDSMGFDEDEISILATSLKDIQNKQRLLWSNAFNPKRYVNLFE